MISSLVPLGGRGAQVWRGAEVAYPDGCLVLAVERRGRATAGCRISRFSIATAVVVESDDSDYDLFDDGGRGN